jgi:hypothetical protein
MGNQLAGMAKGSWSSKGKKKKQQERSLKRSKSSRDGRSVSVEEEMIQQQALALALQQHQKAQMRLERSMSQRTSQGALSTSSGKLPRSASTRARSVADPVVQPHQLLNGTLVSFCGYCHMHLELQSQLRFFSSLSSECSRRVEM